MTDAGASSPSGGLPGVARALVAAARSRALYQREHPAVAVSLSRLRSTLQHATAAAPLVIGITPTALMADEGQAIAESLARFVYHDRTSLMALIALKKYDDYTFTHMVNVAVLAMSLSARNAHRADQGHHVAARQRHLQPVAPPSLHQSDRAVCGRNFGTAENRRLAVVTHEHPADPFRPQVKIVRDGRGDAVEEPFLVNTWEIDGPGDYPRAVVEALDPEKAQVDPLPFLNPTSGNSGGTA